MKEPSKSHLIMQKYVPLDCNNFNVYKCQISINITYHTITKMETFVKPRKVPPQNVVVRLFARQTFAYKKPATHFHLTRQFYQNVFPNFTVINVEKPPCFLRKFSPDGKHFIAFSADQTALEIYTYKGPSAACDLLQRAKSGKGDKRFFDIKSKLFERFFKVLFFVFTISCFFFIFLDYF